MAKGITDRKHYDNIASAIRAKNGGAVKYKPSEMADAILAIDGGVEAPNISNIIVFDTLGIIRIQLEDGEELVCYASFDENGMPISLSDDNGNTVNFDSGYPVSATDIFGNTIPIFWG